MTKRLAGVALAAVMACGWASGAEAFSFTAYNSISGQVSDAFPLYSLTIDGHHAHYEINIIESEICDYDPDCTSNGYVIRSVADGYANISLTQYTNDDPTFFADYFHVSLNTTLITTSYDLPPGHSPFPGSGDEGNTNYQTSYKPFLVNFDIVYLSNGDIYINSKDYNNYFNFDQFTIDPSVVPLPASAPLFGAALLGLAGLGYGMKRRSRVPGG